MKIFRWIKNKLWQRKYKRYLKTSEWKHKRNEVLVRDLCHCQDCGSQKKLEVHHLTYERVFNEHLDDLITLCSKCHRKRHKKG